MHFDTFFKKLTDSTDFWDFPQHGKDRYLQHNEMIRKMVPRGKFLEYIVKVGWGPLCAFLGKPVPDVPFPRVNEKAHLQMVMRRILRYQAVVAVGKTAAVVGVLVMGSVYLVRGRVWV